MSKYTIIGDPHVVPKSLDKGEQIFDIIEEEGNDAIILGDLLHTKEVIRGKCLNLYFRRIQQSKLNFIIIVGNHDYFNLECEEHSLEALKVLPNVTIVDELTLINNMAFLPYIHDKKELKDTLKLIKNSDVLFGHFDMAGFDYGNGYICDDGLEVKNFKSLKKVISGHFHKYQQEGNFTYLGTPFSHSFGESNQDKYIGIFDSETLELELKETPFPKHITETIDCNTQSSMEFYPENDHIRLILTGDQQAIDAFKYASDIPNNIKIIERASDTFMNDIEINESADNLMKFQEWASDIKKLDNDTKKLGLKILEALK